MKRCNGTTILTGCIGLWMSILVQTPSSGAGPAKTQQSIAVDILLQNGMIIDGTGDPPFRGDVGIVKNQIVAVGEFTANVTGAMVLNCQGLVISPGFIDLHSHSDSSILHPLTRGNMNFLRQGCTTVVTGNCGGGPIKVKEYYDQIDRLGAGTNVMHLIPQGAVRRAVLGNSRRAPNEDERTRMLNIVETGMSEGAWGMSTGLIYVPSSYADTDELVSLAEVVARHDGIYVSHMRGEGTVLLDSVDELLEIGQRAGLPVHASHFKASGQDAWGLVRAAAEKMTQARAKGQIVTADQYPYIASSTSLSATLVPTWAREGGKSAMVQRLEDVEHGAELRKKIGDTLQKRDGGRAIRIARYTKRPQWVGRDLASIATAEQKSPLEIALAILTGGDASIVNFSMNEQDVRFVMQVPWVATASDGRATRPGSDKPHPRFYGTFPRKIGHYAVREKVISVEAAVRSATLLPAEILGLSDRGQLKPGTIADVVVWNRDEFLDRATFANPHQYATGLQHCLVNGTLAIRDGEATGALAGKSIRKK
jgi:N-acyl-D-aspartate/D-glutamate deacylase